MDSQHHEDAGHGEGHGVHLPDPSIWPLLVGVAALVVGIALIWWSRDRNNDFSGPILGAAVVCVFAAAAGWAYDDSRMRRKAEAAARGEAGPARYTQVLAFAVPEGQLDAARAKGGIVNDIEHSELRDKDGFQDLRVVVSPAGVGPAQVLVETTWARREGLEGYEATRQTLLDTVNANAGQVVPGSVQVFDMEVVRDTKEVAFKFGFAAASALVGSLLVGGFMIGAGLTLFQDNAPAAEAPANGGATPGATDPYKVVGTDNAFKPTSLQAPPDTDVTFTFENQGKVKHNLHFLDAKGGKTLADGAEGAIIDGGATAQVKFKTPAAGTYYYQCDIHPDQMSGAFEVKAGAPAPGAAAAGGATAAGNTVTATDNAYDKKELTAKAGEDFSVTLVNKGKVKHNISFYDKAGGTALPGGTGDIIDGGQQKELKFKAPAAGTYYYQCDIHPDQMKGDFKVQ